MASEQTEDPESGDTPQTELFEEETVVFAHGETAVLRITPTGGECPVCAYPSLNKPAYVQDAESGKAIPSFEYCPCCDTQFGWDDKVAPDAPKNALHRIWSELRRKWLQFSATEDQRQRAETRFGKNVE